MPKVLKQNTECWYQVGDRVRVLSPIDLGPYGKIAVGERGTVAYVGGFNYTEILLDTFHHDLREYANHLWLIPPDTDEIENAIALEC